MYEYIISLNQINVQTENCDDGKTTTTTTVEEDNEGRQ